MISSAADYINVVGDNVDADHPHGDLDRVRIDGTIMPLRDSGDKTLRGEDVAFLMDAWNARYQAMLGRAIPGGQKQVFSRKVCAANLQRITSSITSIFGSGGIGYRSDVPVNGFSLPAKEYTGNDVPDHLSTYYPEQFITTPLYEWVDKFNPGDALRKSEIEELFEELRRDGSYLRWMFKYARKTDNPDQNLWPMLRDVEWAVVGSRGEAATPPTAPGSTTVTLFQYNYRYGSGEGTWMPKYNYDLQYQVPNQGSAKINLGTSTEMSYCRTKTWRTVNAYALCSCTLQRSYNPEQQIPSVNETKKAIIPISIGRVVDSEGYVKAYPDSLGSYWNNILNLLGWQQQRPTPAEEGYSEEHIHIWLNAIYPGFDIGDDHVWPISS